MHFRVPLVHIDLRDDIQRLALDYDIGVNAVGVSDVNLCSFANCSVQFFLSFFLSFFLLFVCLCLSFFVLVFPSLCFR